MAKVDRQPEMKKVIASNDMQQVSRPMKRRRTPVQRAILFQAAVSGDASRQISGTLYANDFGDGATTHSLDGYLTDWRGVERRFSGRLDGVQFVSPETRGAPKKTGRDVALHLAYMWFLGRAKRLMVAKPENSARENVMQLWMDKGFRGVSEETHLRRHLRTGVRAAHGLSLLRFEVSGPNADGAVIPAPTDAFTIEQERIAINGKGWFWRHGMEIAVYGNHSAIAPLKNE